MKRYLIGSRLFIALVGMTLTSLVIAPTPATAQDSRAKRGKVAAKTKAQATTPTATVTFKRRATVAASKRPKPAAKPAAKPAKRRQARREPTPRHRKDPHCGRPIYRNPYWVSHPPPYWHPPQIVDPSAAEDAAFWGENEPECPACDEDGWVSFPGR